MTADRALGFNYPEQVTQDQELLQDNSEINVIFIHSKLDDIGLTGTEFRIFAHLSRRAGIGSAFPSVDSIARQCLYNPRTVRETISRLITYGMIQKQDRPGYSSLYRITKPSVWKTSLIGTLESKRNQARNTTPADIDTPADMIQGYPCGHDTGGSSGHSIGEVHPLKLIQSKVIQESTNGVRVPPAGRKRTNQEQDQKKDKFHQELKEEWCKEYQSRFGGKYYFQGGKDGKAIKFLAGTGMSVEEIIVLARKAWDSKDHFFASNTTSLMGFWSLLNRVQAVLAEQETPALPT